MKRILIAIMIMMASQQIQADFSDFLGGAAIGGAIGGIAGGRHGVGPGIAIGGTIGAISGAHRSDNYDYGDYDGPVVFGGAYGPYYDGADADFDGSLYDNYPVGGYSGYVDID